MEVSSQMRLGYAEPHDKAGGLASQRTSVGETNLEFSEQDPVRIRKFQLGDVRNGLKAQIFNVICGRVFSTRSRLTTYLPRRELESLTKSVPIRHS